MVDDGRLRLRVRSARWEAEGITSFRLARVDGAALPPWTPGAHLDLHLPSGAIRQYSLCGDPADLSAYRIAVLEQPHGRGGSVEAHRELRPGVLVEVGVPRTHFDLVEAEQYVFVAGGIGITPLLPMVREVRRRGARWHLIYGARSAGHYAFAAELRRLGAGAVRFVDGVLDLAGIVAGSTGAQIYACGPAGLLDALTELMRRAGRAGELHLERFATAPVATAPGGGFEVELARSGLRVPVGADETILEAVRAAGVEVPSSCETGICGTCETKVLAGTIEHRDELLTEGERATGSTMMVCVSRASCPRLVLDL